MNEIFHEMTDNDWVMSKWFCGNKICDDDEKNSGIELEDDHEYENKNK